MAKKNKKKNRVPTQPETTPTGLGGFGALLASAGLEASAPDDSSSPDLESPPPQDTLRVPPKVALQTSRKGRGGRTVTVVRNLPTADLADWAKAARKALGCGASVDGDAVVLQGDIRERAAAWFTAQGVRKVSR